MPQNSTADQVRNTLDRWLTAFNEKDADTLFSLYDPDTVYANAGAARMEGVDGLKPWYEEVLKDSSLRVYFKEETLFDSEDLALIAGKFHFRNHSADGSFTPGPAGRVAVGVSPVSRRAVETGLRHGQHTTGRERSRFRLTRHRYRAGSAVTAGAPGAAARTSARWFPDRLPANTSFDEHVGPAAPTEEVSGELGDAEPRTRRWGAVRRRGPSRAVRRREYGVPRACRMRGRICAACTQNSVVREFAPGRTTRGAPVPTISRNRKERLR